MVKQLVILLLFFLIKVYMKKLNISTINQKKSGTKNNLKTILFLKIFYF